MIIKQTNRVRQAGITLIELMVGMVVGLIVIGGVFTIYIAVIESSNETIKQSRLNSEMSALMNIMANDIRRAGFWETNTNWAADGNDTTFTAAELAAYIPHENPFAMSGDTALSVRNLNTTTWLDSGAASATTAAVATTHQCILYTYDADRNGAMSDAAVSNGASRQWSLDSNAAWQQATNTGASEAFGFKRDANSVWMRTSCQGTVDCTPTGAAGTSAHINHCDGGTWQRVTDENTVTITELTFDLSTSTCINASEPDGVDTDGANGIDDNNEYNCYNAGNVPAANSGDNTAEIRSVIITLKAQLVSDPIVTGTLVQTVRVRNDLIRKR